MNGAMNGAATLHEDVAKPKTTTDDLPGAGMLGTRTSPARPFPGRRGRMRDAVIAALAATACVTTLWIASTRPAGAQEPAQTLPDAGSGEMLAPARPAVDAMQPVLPSKDAGRGGEQRYRGVELPPTNAGQEAARRARRIGMTVFAGEDPTADRRSVGRIRVELDRDNIPADGISTVELTVRVQDLDGRPWTAGEFATIEASAGSLLLPEARTVEGRPEGMDRDRVVPGTQVKLVNGEARLRLVAPASPQDVQVRVNAGGLQLTGSVGFVPALREMVATGLVEAIIRLDDKAGRLIDPVRDDDTFEREIKAFSRDFNHGKGHYAGRAAMFLRGRIKGDALLTLAYDSDKPEVRRLLGEIRPESFYPVYGDASIRRLEAKSDSRLYLRVDKDRSYVVYGNYETGTGFSQTSGGGSVAPMAKRELGNYNRSLTGVRAHHETKRAVVNGFAAYDSLKQVVEEYRGNGTSGPYAVSNPGGIEGSEKVEVLVRDRNQPSVIVSVTPLAALADYEFEPFSGRILLRAPLRAIDEYGNPVSLRITYEVDQGGERFWLVGADGQFAFGEHLEIGGSLVEDRNPVAPYRLGSANMAARFGPRTWMTVEAARSRSMGTIGADGRITYTAPGTGTVGGGGGVGVGAGLDELEGDAIRADLRHEGERLRASATYGHTDREFNNPASSLTGGRQEGQAELRFGLTDHIDLYAGGRRTKDGVTEARRDTGEAGVAWTLSSQWTVDVGVNRIVEDNGNSTTTPGSTVPVAITAPLGQGFGFGGIYNSPTGAIDPITGQPMVSSNGAWAAQNGSFVQQQAVPVETTNARLRLTWRGTENLTLIGELEQSVTESDYRRYAFGGRYRFADRWMAFGKIEHYDNLEAIATDAVDPAGLVDGRGELGLSYRVNDLTRVYGKYERNTGLASIDTRGIGGYRSHAFVVGADTQYMKGGELFSEYRLRDGMAGEDVQGAVGLRNTWEVSETLRLQTSAERLQTFSGQAQQADALAIGAEWMPSPLWRVSGRVEWRRTGETAAHTVGDVPVPAQPRSTSVLSTVGVARKLNRDWTLLARNYRLTTDLSGTSGTDRIDNRFQVGGAYRDTDRNRVNLLTKYEYWQRTDSTGVAGYEGFDKHIVSLHADWHPTRPWWFSGRFAAKRQSDRFDGRRDDYDAYLIGARAVYDLTERWDVGVLASRLFSPVGSSQQWALGLETGYRVADNLWASIGYNWRGFSADDMVGANYTNRGLFLRLRFKFDEDLFQGRNPEVNRALPRS